MRGPDGKIHSFFLSVGNRMGAQLIVNLIMGAFTEKIAIHLADNAGTDGFFCIFASHNYLSSLIFKTTSGCLVI